LRRPGSRSRADRGPDQGGQLQTGDGERDGEVAEHEEWSVDGGSQQLALGAAFPSMMTPMPENIVFSGMSRPMVATATKAA
jgi:hypothetical protein